MNRYNPYTDEFINDVPDTSVGDTISRQAAIDVLDAYQVKVENGEENPYAWARLRMSELSSVTPKQRTGKWIPVGIVEAVGEESAQWGSAIAYHRCSECDGQALGDDFEQEVLSKWCPHCGAKMEGVSND